jgi:putative flippase GtrA
MIRLAQWLLNFVSANSASLAAWVSEFDPLLLGRNFALALAVIIVLFWNFGINRIWTYSDAP